MAETEASFFNEVAHWGMEYGQAGVDDKRAVETFMDIETKEKVKAFRGQLYTISQGRYNEEILDQTVGVKRKVKHGSYDQWAKLMLLWMANYKA